VAHIRKWEKEGFNMKDIIVGYGEIGKAVYKCYEENDKPYTVDIESNPNVEDNINCMHICIPFFDKDQFIDAVRGYINEYKPKIVILHSTIPPGTTRIIFENEKDNIQAIAHSPCCGVHPHLYESIKFVFTKILGMIGTSEGKGCISDILVIDMGLKYVEQYNSPEETEMTKILSTTIYAHHIAIVTEVNRICEEYGLDFDNVFTKWTKNYNRGYQKLDKDHFVRPVLKPHKGGKYGGHCISENIKLIERYITKTWLTDIQPKDFIGE